MVIILSLYGLSACKSDPVDSSSKDPAPEPVILEEMDAVSLLNRLSLDLRGVRPSDAEIEAVQADPEALDDLIDEFLYDPRFSERVVDLYSEIYLTYNEYSDVTSYTFGIADYPGFVRASAEEAPRILGYVAEHDLPWTDIVTADWTMMNELLAEALPTDYPAGGDGWMQARYTDGRPAAGVLATSTLWWRYTSTDSNANRSRANTVSRILLCNDYLTRPIDFDRNINLLDEDSVLNALKTNESCVNCHVSLDPLASYFFGFWSYLEDSASDVSEYHPERELLWEDYTDVAPAYYGEPGYSLTDLGYQIANDNRFVECATEQAYTLFLRRDAALADSDHLSNHRNAFLEGDLTYRSLVRSVVNDPWYRAGEATGEEAVTLKMVTPELLSSQVEDLTGYSWVYAGYDMLRSDLVGVRTLAGGADGYTVTENATDPNATLILVQQRLAEAASSHAMDTEREQKPAERRLFTEVDFTETPDTDEAAMVAQIQALHRRVLGNVVEAGGEEVAANLELWQALYDVDNDVHAAWTGVLYALLRDPEFLVY